MARWTWLVMAGTFAAGDLAAQRAYDAERVARIADSMAGLPLWPGFDARRDPALLYDGARTLLVRFPRAAAGFEAGADGAQWYAGRHPLVTGNSWVSLEGVTVGTLLPAGEAASDPALAATLVHELFHVHQRREHPGWVANEAAVFDLPLGEAAPLAARRLESATLAAALAASDPDASACRARAALAVRRERFAALPAEAARYERHLELSEGLAEYVERLALGERSPPALPADEYPADATRLRAYWSGAALAWLLDRHGDGWQARADAEPGRYLDELLAEALGAGPACGLARGARERIASIAARDAAGASDAVAARVRAFDVAPGATLEIVAEGAPFSVARFDPGNVTPLDRTRVLHTRALTLVRGADTVDVLGRDALTEAAGPHPLFAGVRRIRVTGLPALDVQEAQGEVHVCQGGACARLARARVERAGTLVRVVALE